MELISNLPKVQATHMKKMFHTMVEAKQNCEAIAFRGHRLLDQVRYQHFLHALVNPETFPSSLM